MSMSVWCLWCRNSLLIWVDDVILLGKRSMSKQNFVSGIIQGGMPDMCCSRIGGKCMSSSVMSSLIFIAIVSKRFESRNNLSRRVS